MGCLERSGECQGAILCDGGVRVVGQADALLAKGGTGALHVLCRAGEVGVLLVI